jgi:hypothetical protein
MLESIVYIAAWVVGVFLIWGEIKKHIDFENDTDERAYLVIHNLSFNYYVLFMLLLVPYVNVLVVVYLFLLKHKKYFTKVTADFYYGFYYGDKKRSS